MSSLVLDLQQEVLNKDCDILNALRKAHLIASKLQLKEFDIINCHWLLHFSFGICFRSPCRKSISKEHSSVKGSYKIHYHQIPAICHDKK